MTEVQRYQSVLWEVIQARGEDAPLALKVWCQWEFENLLGSVIEVFGELGPDQSL